METGEQSGPSEVTVPTTFCFTFPNGETKWEKDMTREELIHVINHLFHERERSKKSIRDLFEIV